MCAAPGRVSFGKGALTGTSVGMTYDDERDVLSLLDQVRVKVAAGTTTGTGADIVAGRGVYARSDKRMDFERGVRIVRAGRTVSAESARAFLADDESHLKGLELRTNSQITTPDAAEGALQSMAARDMDLDVRRRRRDPSARAADGRWLDCDGGGSRCGRCVRPPHRWGARSTSLSVLKATSAPCRPGTAFNSRCPPRRTLPSG